MSTHRIAFPVTHLALSSAILPMLIQRACTRCSQSRKLKYTRRSTRLLIAAHKWPGLRSVFAVERIVDVRGMLSKETSYYISSSDVSARELLGAVREHWKIESMHWLLDVTFSEDESRFLSENVHTTMNALRKFALTVHKNYLAASGKKRSLKANMLAALIRPENLLDLFAFL